MSQPLSALLSLAVPGTGTCLEKSGPWLSIPPGQGTSCHRSGASLQRGHRGKVASAYLHANHRIDEEQHGYEEGNIGQCLEEGSSWLSACLSPPPPHRDCLGAE